jgi:hypothetical protein
MCFCSQGQILPEEKKAPTEGKEQKIAPKYLKNHFSVSPFRHAPLPRTADPVQYQAF